ncbi:hypothetical protein BGAL_0631g00050 [Botrytis galanthina]|uniref:Uncharacterized protein n=1 Tax=Botrytis galanthina TaxID=278940 RepID=A0A4S8QN01_9HELO|nr:hypothetical protein BGAL_0631g00050 [Botrytis galanthina]
MRSQEIQRNLQPSNEGKGNYFTAIPSGSRDPHHRKQSQDPGPIENPKYLGYQLQSHDRLISQLLDVKIDLIEAQWDAIYRKKIEDLMIAQNEIHALLVNKEYEGWDEERGKKAEEIIRKLENFDIQPSEYEEDPKVKNTRASVKTSEESLKNCRINHGVERTIRKYKESTR